MKRGSPAEGKNTPVLPSAVVQTSGKPLRKHPYLRKERTSTGRFVPRCASWELQSRVQANELVDFAIIVNANFHTVEPGSVNMDRVLLEHPNNKMKGASPRFTFD